MNEFWDGRIRIRVEGDELVLRAVGDNNDPGVPEAIAKLEAFVQSLAISDVSRETHTRLQNEQKRIDCIRFHLKTADRPDLAKRG